MADVSPGALVTLSDGRRGTARFVGNTHFAPGDWIGVELDEPTGKNDGSVQGERYFDCEPGFGMFVRPSVIVAVMEPPQRDPRPSIAGAVGPRGRPPSATSGSIVSRRQSTLSAPGIKRHSVNAPSPSPARTAAPRTLRSPTKSPTKQLSSAPIASSRVSSTAPQRPSTVTMRSIPPSITTVSIGPPSSTSSKVARSSLTGLANRATKSAPQSSAPTSIGSARRSSVRPASKTVTEETDTQGRAPVNGLGDSRSPDVGSERSISTLQGSKREPGSLRPAAPKPGLSPGQSLSSPRAAQSSADTRELDEAKARLKVMERKHAEDREKLKMLEQLQAERDKFERVIQRLEAKYQPQQLEISELRKKLKVSESRLEEVERLQAEHDSLLEMATLDREMAEETADAYKHECETLRLKLEELQLEVEVLREENEELGQVMSPEEKSSQGWLQMIKTNERLREALIRLRDLTQQQESELRDQIKELEQDLEDFEAVKSQYESAKEKLLVYENNVEDLKQQLESALGAEEMIEELAEKNMRYQEEINELKAAIADLEALKEINDELEVTHLETEKQLQEEIDYRDTLFGEQSRRIAQQDDVIEDLEYTLSRFRELVSTLQSDLEDMRASQQISEAEANELSTRSRAMMDLNMKLQASVAKAQTKSIEVELGHMEAEEASQHLSIVLCYLPEYFDGERNSVLALLRFRRVRFKAFMMHNTIRERIFEQATMSTAPEELFAVLDVLEKLLWISSICDRFLNFVSSCSPEIFVTIEVTLFELEPVERTLNSWIESLKKNDIDIKNCAIALQRSIALLSHLAEIQLPSNYESFAEELYMSSLLTQAYLDHSAMAVARLKTILQTKLGHETEEYGESAALLLKLDAFVSQARSFKVAIAKITRSLEDLKLRCLALPKDASEPFKRVEEAAEELSKLARQIGENIALLVSEEGRVEPFTLDEIEKNMWQAVMTILQSSQVAVDGQNALALLSEKLRGLGSYIEDLDTLSSDLSRTVEFEKRPAPWTVRAEELKSSKAHSPDADEEIRRLKNEIHEASTALGVKDKTLEEQGIKIEHLESRMREASKKASLVKELEAKAEKLRARESDLQMIIEKQKKDIQTLDAEREDYRARLEKIKRFSGNVATADGVFVDAKASLATMRENESLRAEVASLQAAVRFLRGENRRSSLLNPYSVQRSVDMYSWLDAPLTFGSSASAQREQMQQAALESREVFAHLVRLTKESPVCDLRSFPGFQEGDPRRVWRPSKSKLTYQTLKQREDLERWTEWKDDVARYEREQGRLAAAKRERIGRENSQKHARLCSELGRPANLSRGVVGRAWQILGLQRDGDPKVHHGLSAGAVDIVSDE